MLHFKSQVAKNLVKRTKSDFQLPRGDFKLLRPINPSALKIGIGFNRYNTDCPPSQLTYGIQRTSLVTDQTSSKVANQGISRILQFVISIITLNILTQCDLRVAMYFSTVAL